MRRLLKRTDTGIIIGCIFVFVLFSLWNPQQWFDWGNLSNIGQYTAILGLLAIGQTFVILIREIDLSVGSVYGIVGITFVSLENSNVSVPVSFILAMLLALLIGLVNAVLVVRGKLSSMIVTLGGLFFYRGLVYVTTHGAVTGVPQAARENWLAQLLGGRWLRIENEFLLLLLLAFLCAVILGPDALRQPPACGGRGPGQRGVSGCSGKPGKNLRFLPLLVLRRIVGDRDPRQSTADQCFPGDRDGTGVDCRRGRRRNPAYRWERNHPWHRPRGILLHCSSLPNDRTGCAAFMVRCLRWDRSSCRCDHQYPLGQKTKIRVSILYRCKRRMVC